MLTDTVLVGLAAYLIISGTIDMFRANKVDTTSDNKIVSTIPHLVKAGDTLYSIAEKYGVFMSDISELNGISCYTDKLPQGSTIYIPVFERKRRSI